MIKRLEAEQLHSKEVYNYGYHAHISPRLSNNPSANQSFMSGDKRSIGKHMSTTSVDDPNNKSQLKLHPMYDDDRAANNLSYKLSEIKRQFNLQQSSAKKKAEGDGSQDYGTLAKAGLSRV